MTDLHDFDEQNEIGLAGEKWVCDSFGWTKLGGRRSDILTHKNTYMELKAETRKFKPSIVQKYSLLDNPTLSDFFDIKTFKDGETENLFIETTSDTDAETVGGPYRTLAHGIPEYAHIFPRYLVFFLFNTRFFVEQLNLNQKYLRHYKGVKNRTYHSSGYLLDLATVDWEVSSVMDKHWQTWVHLEFKGFNSLLKKKFQQQNPNKFVTNIFEDASISNLLSSERMRLVAYEG